MVGQKEMNKQRKVLITITYNEMGIIIDTKAEEVAQPNLQQNLQQTCNQLATDCKSRQAAIEAANKLVDRFEQILRDIREKNEDESVCGLCEYDGAFIGQSGDWCNECSGFDKADCFKLSDERRKKWLKELDLPSVQPEQRSFSCGQENDLIGKRAAIDTIDKYIAGFDAIDANFLDGLKTAKQLINDLPAVIPERKTEIVRCKDCKYSDENWRRVSVGWLPCMDVRTGSNWFCGSAERREE